MDELTRSQMPLRSLLEGVSVVRLEGEPDLPVSGVTHDSRRVVRGDLFVALAGREADGHRFIAEALERGAAAIVVSRPIERGAAAALVQVSDGRLALAQLAAAFWGAPSRELDLIGITGTNGKTTLSYLLESILMAAGRRPGVIGTIEVRFAGQRLVADHTTPESSELQALLRQMRDAGVDSVAMETSSHALDLQRVRSCHFRLAVFTNLSRDHLDYHGDMESYAEAKALLFSRELVESRADGRIAVANSDDPAWRRVVGGWNGPVLRFGRGGSADVRPEGDWTQGLDGLRGRVRTPAGPLEVRSSLVGRHNAENLLAAIACGLALGLSPEVVAEGLQACDRVPGRLERVPGPGPAVFIDYAHTDAALTKVLSALRELCRGRLIAVFGCGGDRDRGKRPLMGEAVGRGADLAIVTSDNPRTEDPNSILDQIVPGLNGIGWQRVTLPELAQAGSRVYAVVPDRRQAIERAVEMATAEDVLLVAGKGHEAYQIVGRERQPFDDCAVASRALGLRAEGESA